MIWWWTSSGPKLWNISWLPLLLNKEPYLQFGYAIFCTFQTISQEFGSIYRLLLGIYFWWSHADKIGLVGSRKVKLSNIWHVLSKNFLFCLNIITFCLTSHNDFVWAFCFVMPTLDCLARCLIVLYPGYQGYWFSRALLVGFSMFNIILDK